MIRSDACSFSLSLKRGASSRGPPPLPVAALRRYDVTEEMHDGLLPGASTGQ